MIARVNDCIQFIDENYEAATFRTLYSDKPGDETCPTVYELEPDTYLESLRGIDDHTGQLEDMETSSTPESVFGEDFGEATVPNSAIPIDCVTYEQNWTAMTFDGCPMAREAAFTTFNAGGLDESDEVSEGMMLTSSMVDPAGAFSTVANDNSP